MQGEWKLFDGAYVEHLEGSVYVLYHKTRTDGFPALIAQGITGEPVPLDIGSLTPVELRAIANFKEK